MEEINQITYFCKKKMRYVLNNLYKEIHHIRIGSRSIAALLEKIKVKCYDTKLFLPEISTITIIDNMNITIQPWDISIISNIDKTIINENLGIVPTNNGKLIHIKIPIITEEGRKILIKKIKKLTELSKILIRNIRKKSKQSIKKLNISEDLCKTSENKIQNITTDYIKKIDFFFLKKEQEILRI